MRLVTPLEMMKLEERTAQAGITYDMMMERAGAGLAEHLFRIAQEHGFDEILMLCGSGNNAGDCFAAANLLARRISVTVCLLSGFPKTRTAYTKYKMMDRVTVLTDMNEIRAAVQKTELIADGVFGIGFRGELSPFVKELFSMIDRDPDKRCVAVDIPSGGNGMNGTVTEGTPHCIATVTFGAAKTGLFLHPLAEHCGAIFLVDIGIPEEAFSILSFPLKRITGELVHSLLPPRPVDAHKGMFGRLLTVAGSRNMPGAAMLATEAALRSGVGMCCLASDADVCRLLIAQTPEAILQPLPTDAAGKLSQEAISPILTAAKDATAVLVGPGLGQSDAVASIVRTLLERLECPVILDADGLNVIAKAPDILRRAKGKVIVTPHPGEMARLMSCTVAEVQADRMTTARRFVKRFPETVLVLKGAGTIVATTDSAYINTNGNSGMSKGGSGDVLAGLIAGLAAQGLEPTAAAQCGVYLHGLAGDCAAAEFSRRAMLPSDLIRQLPLVFSEYE